MLVVRERAVRYGLNALQQLAAELADAEAGPADRYVWCVDQLCNCRQSWTLCGGSHDPTCPVQLAWEARYQEVYAELQRIAEHAALIAGSEVLQ